MHPDFFLGMQIKYCIQIPMAFTIWLISPSLKNPIHILNLRSVLFFAIFFSAKYSVQKKVISGVIRL